MSSTPSVDDARRRHRLVLAIGDALRDLRAELSLLNHHVGARVELKDVDLECLDLLDRHGTLSPSALAKRAGLHPATMTGILDRLERGGWITRDRAGTDRRSVVVSPTRHRIGEMLRLYSGMNAELNKICSGYDAHELALIADFLRRVAEAGHRAADELAGD
ncbi:MAG TPA: MarR family transcriptional regulator [Actinophytocola sp.]|uniref:MarR family winged helix-turn-helix transcriptional regulator n=1 Tax=Actinophytocola sp. TaxID=1872138 RepID=UPI002DDCF458|nr:MarR family transcriptional regulator [Actinophytocola sp.]HEV2784427.1 MarR family transcriptional regulator [Actinophytocola sp.]